MTVEQIPIPVIVAALTLMASAIVLEHGTGNAFIYFQF
jgi:hypothetical protein